MSMQIYIFDVDGVLLDVNERLRIAEEMSRGNKELFWQYFFSEDLLSLDKPRRIGIDLLLDRAKRGLIAIVTGRPKRLYRATIKQLEEIGIPRNIVWRLEMRDNNDKRKSWIVKTEKILNIVYEGFEVIEIHDDDEEFLRYIKKKLPRTRVFLHRDNNVIELFKSLPI